jgi:predicted DNA-binding transcriptional regulator AlpA
MTKTIQNALPKALPTLPAEGYVRFPQIKAVYPVSRSSWLAGVKSGRYPQPIKIGERLNAWKVEDIRKLIGQ